MTTNPNTVVATDPGQHPVGETLRRLRTRKGLSLKDLAARSGVSVGMISQVERGLANPSIRLLTSLRRALNVSMQELFGESPDDAGTAGPDPDFVRRLANRPEINLGDLQKSLLTPGSRQHLQLMILKLGPRAESGGRALSYPAEKGGLVLQGQVTLKVGDVESVLHEGDSFVFDSAVPHSLRNVSDQPAEVLWVIGAVQFDRHL
jgi:transcriptional regulator with XRE-family HTH domain